MCGLDRPQNISGLTKTFFKVPWVFDLREKGAEFLLFKGGLKKKSDILKHAAAKQLCLSQQYLLKD